MITPQEKPIIQQLIFDVSHMKAITMKYPATSELHQGAKEMYDTKLVQLDALLEGIRDVNGGQLTEAEQVRINELLEAMTAATFGWITLGPNEGIGHTITHTITQVKDYLTSITLPQVQDHATS